MKIENNPQTTSLEEPPKEVPMKQSVTVPQFKGALQLMPNTPYLAFNDVKHQ